MQEMFPHTPGIYAIWLLQEDASEKAVYVGKAVNLRRRQTRHLSALANGKHENIRLQRFWARYGEDRMRFEILESLDTEVDEVLFEREQHWIDQIVARLGRAFLVNVCLIVDAPPRPPKGQPNEKIQRFNRDVAFQDYLSGLTLEQLATKYGVTPGSISMALSKNPGYLGRRRLHRFDENEAFLLYREGLTLKEIADYYGATAGAVCMRLQKNPEYIKISKERTDEYRQNAGVRLRSDPRWRGRRKMFPREEALRLYEEGWSHKRLAKHYGLKSDSSIYNALKKMPEYVRIARPAGRIKRS